MRMIVRLPVLLVAALVPFVAAAQSPDARIAARSFPSIFEAWNPADALLKDGVATPLSSLETPDATLARHDLAFLIPNGLGLKSVGDTFSTDYTPKSLEKALARRAELLKLNPNLVILASVGYRNAHGEKSGIPEDSPWWKRDASGQRVAIPSVQYGAQYYLDYAKPEFQDVVAAQCKGLAQSGVFDGCMFDWWSETLADDPVDPDGRYRLQLIKKVRAAVGDNAILVANTNNRKPEKTAPYLNGMFMEGFGARYFSDWRVAASDLIWGQTHLRKPAIPLLEGWYLNTGRDDLKRMREVTTLSLTLSDGYSLFADPNTPKTLNHTHDWYPFWDHSLGRPISPPARKLQERAYRREFEKGEAVFNPPDAPPAKLHFAEPRTRASNGQKGKDFVVDAADGDLFLKN